MALIAGWVRSSSTAVLSPCSTLNTPAGSPASAQSSAIQIAAVGSFSRGLEDDGVAGGDGDGEEPHRDHGGEVERGDDADRADGLAEGGDVDVGGGVFGHAAFEQVGDAAGEFDDFLAAGDFAEGVGDDLAVLGGDDFGEFALAGVEQFPECEDHLGALGEGGVAPGGERGGGGVDDGAGVLDAGEGDLTGDGTGRRVRHRSGVAARARERLVVEPVWDRPKGAVVVCHEVGSCRMRRSWWSRRESGTIGIRRWCMPCGRFR